MISLALTKKEHKDLVEILKISHAIDVKVDMLTVDYKYKGSIDSLLIGGAITVDANAEVTRSASLQFLDVSHDLHIDKDDPTKAAMYLDRMIQVTYCVARLGSNTWYEIPVFTGPLVKVDRDGVFVTLEAHGKEILASDVIWSGKTFKKGYLRTQLIQDILALSGETKFKMAKSGSKTSSQTSLKRNENTPMQVARKTAKAINMYLFYDGRGVATTRKKSTRASWLFTDDMILSDPQVGYDMAGVYNSVEVIGGKPKGSKKKVRYKVVAPKSHPLSPSSLGRNGVDRHIPMRIEDDKLKKVAECKATAEKELKKGLFETVTSTFDSLVIPMLEENDLVSVDADGYSGTFAVNQFTIPLQVGEPMSVGYNRRVKPKRFHKKNKKSGGK